MLPRGTPDLSWKDLLAGLAYCVRLDSNEQAQKAVEACWPDQATFACLSVRSGFDLVLQALALPAGSEIIVSAITIPHMFEIIERHGLVVVPIDLDEYDLSIDLQALERAVTPRTKAILIAHLFGSQMPLDEIVAFAKQHNLLLFEDCAQAYNGSKQCGHPDSDVRMLSFGPIKTATALGGALISCNDPELCVHARALQARYPRQSRSSFFKRVVQFSLLKLISIRVCYSLFVTICRLRGHDYDQIINRAVRGFKAGDLFQRIRQQPSTPLLRLLERRLKQNGQQQVQRRVARAQRMRSRLLSVHWPGSKLTRHSHWVIPIASDKPEHLMHFLRAHGFDATRHASTMVAHPAAQQASAMLDKIVYLPMHPKMSDLEEQRLCSLINELFSKQQQK